MREFGNGDDEKVTVKHQLVLNYENLDYSDHFNLHVDDSRVLIEFGVIKNHRVTNRFVNVLLTEGFDRLQAIEIGSHCEYEVPLDSWTWYSNGIFMAMKRNTAGYINGFKY